MDLYNLVVSAKLTKGGGGGDIDVDELSVTENGVYTASSGHAYSPVTVDVPNSYAASDEGKVVSNGALVGQTSATKTANGTYDTTLNNEIVVNVPTVTPTGNINITSTAQTDVSAYATAQVVDADLVASNIKKDVNILGVTGTYEGGGGGGGQSLDDYIAGKLTEVEVTLPSDTQSIGTFTGHSELEKITIKGGGQSLLQAGFSNCQGLKYLDLPETLNDIRQGSIFYKVAQLTTLIVRAVTPPQAYANPGLPSSLTAIYVPSGSVSAYQSATGWSSFASIIQAIPE